MEQPQSILKWVESFFQVTFSLTLLPSFLKLSITSILRTPFSNMRRNKFEMIIFFSQSSTRVSIIRFLISGLFNLVRLQNKRHSFCSQFREVSVSLKSNLLLTFFSLFCPDLAVEGFSDLPLSVFFPPFPAALIALSLTMQNKIRSESTDNTE